MLTECKTRNKHYCCEAEKHITRWDVFKMWFNRKVFLPLLYNFVLYNGKPDYADDECPMCGWSTEGSYAHWWCEGISNYYSNTDGYQSWTAHYKCPKCGTHFYVDESN